ncbi:MAG: YggT family protein [Deltaproteobacteria bacterium]|nr:YggT family protein [Deltaproteobacteria bacterium]
MTRKRLHDGPPREVVLGMTEPSRLTDDAVASDAARRGQQHDDVKANIEGDVNAEIEAEASRGPGPAQARKIEQVAGTFREHAVDEVIDSEKEVRRGRGAARIGQYIDYAFFLIYALLAIRFVLSLIAAKSSAGFVQLIVTITSPFYAPFENIVTSPKTGAGHTLLLPMLVAMGAYLVLHIAVKALLRLVATRTSEI